MTNKEKIVRFLGLSLALVGFVLISGSLTELTAQRDPFSKPGWAKKPEAGAVNTNGTKKGPPADLGAPAIDQRIDYYKRLRETAAASGTPVPKVTSVLTLNEMAVTGIFRTPRGYAAMVEATPLKLSYTIYPGEKFFDGQLVAVEENRLVFRRVVKMSNGKFISSVENKPLRKYSDREEIQGTAPVENDVRAATESNTRPAPQSSEAQVGAKPTVVVSPLEEMNRQKPGDSEKDKSKKDSKKSVRLAKNK
ncbi:MAG: hypothetical protein DMF63_06065 [Acidobacteria bacterium]|nr:MAG: hypothetical protein DMF63_06065 [Acidobacteriota bacterium]